MALGSFVRTFVCTCANLSFAGRRLQGKGCGKSAVCVAFFRVILFEKLKGMFKFASDFCKQRFVAYIFCADETKPRRAEVGAGERATMEAVGWEKRKNQHT